MVDKRVSCTFKRGTFLFLVGGGSVVISGFYGIPFTFYPVKAQALAVSEYF